MLPFSSLFVGYSIKHFLKSKVTILKIRGRKTLNLKFSFFHSHRRRLHIDVASSKILEDLRFTSHVKTKVNDCKLQHRAQESTPCFTPTRIHETSTFCVHNYLLNDLRSHQDWNRTHFPRFCRLMHHVASLPL